MTGARLVTVLIADDEPVARAGLRAMLAAVEWVTCIGEAANGPAAVDAINALRPELVFLDIEMPGLIGTEVMRRVTHHPHVIFTTAWAQHAAAAFELGALDYLLKPFGAERLEARLDAPRSVRIHRTSIVSLNHVVAFRTVEKGRVVAELDDGTRLEVSRNKAKELRELSE